MYVCMYVCMYARMTSSNKGKFMLIILMIILSTIIIIDWLSTSVSKNDEDKSYN